MEKGASRQKESDAHSTHPALHFYMVSDTAYHRLTLKFFLHKVDSKASERLIIRACKNLGHDNEIVNRNALESIYWFSRRVAWTHSDKGIYRQSHGQNSVSFLYQLPGLRVPTVG